MGECQLWLTHRIVSSLLSSGVFLPELQPQSEYVISTLSFKINTGLHFSFHLFVCCSFSSGLEADRGRNAHTLGCWEMTPLLHTSTHWQRDPAGRTSWAGDTCPSTCPSTGTSPLVAVDPAVLLGCAPSQHPKRCDITVTPSSGDLAHHLSNTSLPRLF